MSIYKRGDFFWYDFTVDGRRYRESTKQTSKRAAERVEARERERAKLGGLHQGIPTLQQASDRWFTARAADRKSALTTAQRLKIAMRHIDGRRPVTEIGTADIEAAIQSRRLDVTHNKRVPTNATVNRDMIDSTLRPILNYCAEVLELPVRRIAWSRVRLQEPKERVRPYTPNELSAYRAKLPVWHRPVAAFLARYGVRLNEAFFPLSAIDTVAWEITIRGPRRKNGRPHVIPLLDDDARDIAARMGRAREAKLDTVWFKEGKSGLVPITARGFQAASKAALQAAGIQDARPAHDFRHHAGTGAMRATGNLKVVQQLLGHESITSTARYAHANASDVREALRQVAAPKARETAEKGSEVLDDGTPAAHRGGGGKLG